jgi:membrane associated rhomboid family serine protease
MNRFGSLPLVTKNILIITVLVWVATVFLYAKVDLTKYLGLHYFQASDFKPYQFVTYIFMHAARDSQGGIIIWHIFFNMFALFMFGPILENTWGPRRFLIFYIFTGLGAALTQLVVYYFQITPVLEHVQELLATTTDFREQTYLLEQKKEFLNRFVVVGASGSLFGLLIAFGMLFPNVELMIMFIPVPIKAKFLVIGYGVLELIQGLTDSTGDDVAHFAHLGGMLFGFILVLIWRRKYRR